MNLLDTIKVKNGITFRQLHRQTEVGQRYNFHELSREIKQLEDSGEIYIRINRRGGDQFFINEEFTCIKCDKSTPTVTRHPDSDQHCLRCFGMARKMRENSDINKMMLAWQSLPITTDVTREIRGGYCA